MLFSYPFPHLSFKASLSSPEVQRCLDTPASIIYGSDSTLLSLNSRHLAMVSCSIRSTLLRDGEVAQLVKCPSIHEVLSFIPSNTNWKEWVHAGIPGLRAEAGWLDSA